MNGGAYPRPALPRWVARIPASSPARQSRHRRQASSARRSAWADRSARLVAPVRRCRCRGRADRAALALTEALRIGDPCAAPLARPGRQCRCLRELRGLCRELRACGAPYSPAAGSCATGAWGAVTTSRRHSRRRRGAARLWRHEMFVPILLVHRGSMTATRPCARERFGHGPDRRVLRRGRRGAVVPRAHRGRRHVRKPSAGATTGAWPGYQPFGGWKGSGSTGKAIASFHYLPLYLREQSRTVVE